jgi:hypothetical protein
MIQARSETFRNRILHSIRSRDQYRCYQSSVSRNIVSQSRLLRCLRIRWYTVSSDVRILSAIYTRDVDSQSAFSSRCARFLNDSLISLRFCHIQSTFSKDETMMIKSKSDRKNSIESFLSENCLDENVDSRKIDSIDFFRSVNSDANYSFWSTLDN